MSQGTAKAQDSWVTVVARLRELRLPVGTSFAVSAGRAVAKVWREDTGQNPAIARRMKWDGSGRGNFAVYPPDFWPLMDNTIMELARRKDVKPEEVAVQPESPLQPTQLGYATALTAIALEVLTGERQRLLWCVDLKRDVGDDADQPLDPTAHQPETKWGSILLKFRDALDRQPHVGQRCKLGMRVRHKLRSSGSLVEAQYSLPWCVDLTVVAAWPPRVGCWRIWPEPPEQTDEHGRKRGELEGDRLPDTFWYDGIPF